MGICSSEERSSRHAVSCRVHCPRAVCFVTEPMLFCSQVCGVFLLFISGAHTLMYLGLYCPPWLRDSFIAAYYLAAAGCVLGGLRARTPMQRALPMLASGLGASPRGRR